MNQPWTADPPAEFSGRAVAAVIEDLLQQLQNPEETKAVHRIRVDIKRLRAWLRLVRYGGDFDWRRHDRRLRDLARQLSAQRDSQVILDTLRWLEQKLEDPAQQRALDQLRSYIGFVPGPDEIDWPAVKEALVSEMDTLRSEMECLDSIGIVQEGLRRTYKRADKRGERAFSSGGGIEDLHQLRKWVKYLYYQIQIIRDTRQDEYGKTHKQLNELGDKLGRIHDLDIVRSRVAQLSGKEVCLQAAAIIERLIDKRMNNLTGRCRRLYRRVFNVSPKAFVRPLDRAHTGPVS